MIKLLQFRGNFYEMITSQLCQTNKRIPFDRFLFHLKAFILRWQFGSPIFIKQEISTNKQETNYLQI